MPISNFRGYDNSITVPDVSIALEHILIAPEGTAWTPGRVNISSPPAGFIHMGAVQEDSPQLQMQKTFYRLQTGIPQVLQYQAVQALQGNMSVVFFSSRSSRVLLSLGGSYPYHVPSTATSGWSFVSSVVDRSTVIVNSTAMSAAFVPGSLLVTDTTPNVNTTLNEAYVQVTSALTGNTVYSVTLYGPDGFPALPIQTAPIFSVAYNQYPMGTKNLPFFRVLGVGDFLNGAQVVHLFSKATPAGQYSEALRSGQDNRVQAQFDLFGYSVSTPYGSASELVLAERFYFPPTSVGL